MVGRQPASSKHCVFLIVSVLFLINKNENISLFPLINKSTTFRYILTVQINFKIL